MAESPETSRHSTAAGHLSVRIDGRPELDFQFAQQPRRLALSFLTTFAIEVAVLVVLYITGRAALHVTGVLPASEPLSAVIFLANQPGPGGGGGGGGNKMPDPPPKVEMPGPDKITIPAAPPPTETVEAKIEPPQIPQLTLPVATLSAGIQEAIGSVAAPAGPPSASQGSGSGGGVGTGRGTGIGSGTGSGLGPGTGGGTGGGVFRPGSGVTDPVDLVRVDPVYTPDAAERRIEGEVWVELVVQPDGRPANVRVIKSLDSKFGLDQQAVKAAERWRFRPGTKDGKPVAVLVTIAIEFSIR
jgi:TonB family protein